MMQGLKIIIAICMIAVTNQACIKQVDVVTRREKPILVVEGSITTDTVPYTVKLTYSGPITSSEDIPDQYLEKNATVTITDDLGNEVALAYTNQGVYETTDPAYIGKVGRSYSVTVTLNNGKKYISTPEKLKPPVPVSSVNVTFVNKFDFNFPTYMNVSVDTKDPAQEENYYRWTFYNWTGRQSKGVGCGFGCIMYEFCYQKFVDNNVRILSDVSINGNEIKNQIVGRCYIYTYLNPFIDIGQISMTRESFQFWKRYQDQLTRTDGILDPLPAAIKGNVYNASDIADFALGYFSAYPVTHKKVVLIPYSITPYLLELSATQFIPPKSQACFDFFPNSLFYPSPPARQYPPPPGWENAEEIKVYW
ncbi:MAG: DUF4249 domain-containing protein [Ferruginibacter sp.]